MVLGLQSGQNDVLLSARLEVQFCSWRMGALDELHVGSCASCLARRTWSTVSVLLPARCLSHRTVSPPVIRVSSPDSSQTWPAHHLARRLGNERWGSSWLPEEPCTSLVHRVKPLLTSSSLVHVPLVWLCMGTEALAPAERGLSIRPLK